MNEEDFFPLHTIRIILKPAGLIRQTKGKFYATEKAEKLVKEENAGILYALLFRTFFQKFNLAYLDGMPPCDGLQQTIAFSFFMIGRHGKDWLSLNDLAPKVILPTVSEQMPQRPFANEPDGRSMVETRIIRPLKRFGLMECRYDEDADLLFYGIPIKAVRKSKLFDSFFQFRLD